jgi:uncharacterized membrane protein (DUF4010 family)
VSLDPEIVRLALAGALGLFLGLEREWSQKSAGIRTYSLISLLGAVFTLLGRPELLAIGGALIIVQSVLLAIEGLLDSDAGMGLTTSMSMLITYGVGALVASGLVLEAVTVTMLSSLLLVLKRELHALAEALSKEEIRSAAEFAILAFVIYPLLPGDSFEVGLRDFTVVIEPQIIWLLVVTVAGIGIVNYVIVQLYGSRGIAVTGFFGGLASSTAVVGAMLDHVKQQPAAASYAVAAILLANAAMATRNLVIALGFTLTHDPLWTAGVPLGAIIVGSVLIAAVTADWSESIDMELETPFSLRNALVFGGLFGLVVIAGGLAQALFGTAGLYVAVGLSGLVSSAGGTTTAVLLYRGGGISAESAVIAILLATGASIIVKAGLTSTSPSRPFARKTAIWSVALLAIGSIATGLLLL